MKRHVSLILSLICILLLSGCNVKNDTPPNNESNKTTNSSSENSEVRDFINYVNDGEYLKATDYDDSNETDNNGSSDNNNNGSCTHKQTKTVTVTVATCTENGKENVVCKDCNEIIKSNAVTATGHNFTNGKCTVCGENSSSFIVPIPTVETINVAALTHKAKSISKITQSSTSIDAAILKVYNGNITKINQIDEYSFVATRNGTYRIEIDGMSADMAVSLYVFNDSGKQISYDSSLFNNGEGLTVELVANKTYTIEVREFHRIYSSVPTLGSYTLNIWNQKPTVDVTNYTQINDSIEYFDQSNYYTFTPSTSGTYRIEVTNMKASTDVMLYIYNDLDERIAYDSSLFNNGEGLTVTLTANKTYTIAVYNFHQNYEYTATALGSYTLNIWNQKPTVDVTSKAQIKDSIQYTDQVNIYNFTVDVAGDHIVKITNLDSSVTTGIYVYNNLDERGAYDTSFRNNDSLSLKNLEIGTNYRIVVEQSSSTGSYTLTIE